MKKFLTLLSLLLVCVGIHAQVTVGSPDWVSPSTSGHVYETVVYARLTTNLAKTDDVGSNLVIGAFIDGYCMTAAAPEFDPKGVVLYTLNIPGTPDELNKEISFKLYDSSTGYEYSLKSPSEMVFTEQGRYGFPPSDGAVVFTLTAAETYTLSPFEVDVLNKDFDVRPYLTVTPTGATKPNGLMFNVTPTGQVFANDTAVYATTVGKGFTLELLGPSNPTSAPAVLASTTFDVVQHATSIDLSQTTITVNKGETDAIKAFMQTAYKLAPDPCTDEVQWETDNTSILEWTIDPADGDGFFTPIAGGTARIRPYILQNKGGVPTKLVPMIGSQEGWITVTVKVPVTSISIDYSVFNGSFKANVGDQKLYERMQRLITVLPADATDKSYTINIVSGDGVVEKLGNTGFKAVGSGAASFKVQANGAEATAAVSATINLTVEKPVTNATIPQNTIYATLTDGKPTDITNDVKANISLAGDASLWASQATATLSGGFVTCDITPSFDATGLLGTYTAVAEGTATMTIDLKWPKYDDWGVSSDELTHNTAQKKFDIVVQTLVSLVGFNVAVTNAVTGQNGTITLTPQPANATYNPDDITVYMWNAYDTSTGDNAWGEALKTGIISETTTSLQYSFTSSIPGFVNVLVTQTDNASGGETTIPVNDPASATPYTFTGFEIGYALDLTAGWQWRSNPCGYVAASELANVFGASDLEEIRTVDKQVYNDPSWGLFGTLTSAAGIQQGELYKVKMTSEHSAVLYGNTVDPSTQVFGTHNADGSISITLNPGWNWVGSPYLFNRNLNNIFSEVLSQMEGCIIIGKTGSAEVSSSHQWEGDLKAMKAGEGYIIKNALYEPINFTFKNEMTNYQPVDEDASAGVRAEGRMTRVWDYDHTRFMNNMTMVATLEDIAHPDQYSIGAFVGDECRGEGIIENGKAFITVHCNAGEHVTFKLYSPYTNDFYPVEEGLKAQTRVGSLQAPFKLHATGVVDGIQSIGSGATTAESYDMSGRPVTSSQRGVTIRRTADGKVRKVIVK